MSNIDELALSPFWAPRFWPTWLFLLALKLVARLPFSVQLRVGHALGAALKRFKRRDLRVARRNLKICFPELDDAARSRLLDEHFRSFGLSIVEMGIGWFSPREKIKALVEIRGAEHIDAAIRAGHGVLLTGAHFTPLEICVAGFESFHHPIATMYRVQRNPMMDVLVRRGRHRFATVQIARDDVRQLLKRLREKFVVMYLPDQTYLGSQSRLLPFFGEPAVTNVAAGKLAQIGDARVLPFFFFRKPDGSGYLVDIRPPLDGVPSDDPTADTRKLVALLEEQIRAVPDQYLWGYKKFKGRPAPLPDVYAESVE